MKVHVVYSHPNPDSYGGAVLQRVLSGLEAGGHEVRLSDLYADGFEPALSAWEREHHLDPPDDKPDIGPYADHLRWCDTLVLVYPTWYGAQPAMLKGWIDRVWVAGVAYRLPEGSSVIRPSLGNIRRIVAITTHGSSKRINVLQGEPGKRTVTRSLRLMCNRFARTSWLACYGVDTGTAHHRAAFLERVERRMRRL